MHLRTLVLVLLGCASLLLAVGCGRSGSGAGDLQAQLAAAQLDYEPLSTGTLPLRAAAGAQRAASRSGRRVRCRAQLRLERAGQPLPLLRRHIRSLRAYVTDATLPLGVLVRPHPLPSPPLAPHPDVSFASLRGGIARLGEQRLGAGGRKVRALSLTDGRSVTIVLEADGTVRAVGPRTGGARPELVWTDGALFGLASDPVAGEPLALAPLEAVELGPVEIDTDGPLFEHYTTAPADGYGRVDTWRLEHVYALRLADGTHAKLWLRTPRHAAPRTGVELHWVHNCAGGRELAPRWVAVDRVEPETRRRPLALALVADNSGSQSEVLPAMQRALRGFVQALGPGDAASLVRVSTEARTITPLTTEPTALEAGIDSLWSTNGWTALYDGIRRGAESLEPAFAAPDAPAPHPAVIVFTDARDNNSADEHDTPYPGDGIDTTLEDCTRLVAGGVHVPVYAIAMGEADREALAAIANGSGGALLEVRGPQDLPRAYETIRTAFESATDLAIELTEDVRRWRTAYVVATLALGGREITVQGYLPLGRPRLRCAGSARAAVPTGRTPSAIARDRGRGWLYVANRAEGSVSVLDPAAGAELDADGDPSTTSRGAAPGVSRIPVGRGPVALALRPGADELLVCNGGDDSVSVIDLGSRTERTRLAVDSGPVAVVCDADGARAWVACRGDGTIRQVVFGETTRIERSVAVGGRPQALALSPDGEHLYVVCGAEAGANERGAVRVLRTSDLLERASVAVGRQPVAVCRSPGGTRLYVANRRSGTLSVLDTSDPEAPRLVAHMRAGRGPCAVTIDPDDRWVHVALAGEDTVLSLRRSDLNVRRRQSVGDSPAAIAALEDGTLQVGCAADDALSVLPVPATP